MSFTWNKLLIWLGVYLGVEILSWLCFGQSTGNIITITLLVGVLMWFGWKRPWLVAYATLAELMIGGKGYLLVLNVGPAEVSIRMVLYVVLGLIAGKTWWQNRRPWSPSWRLPLWLSGWVILATGWGLIQGHALGQTWTDVNSFLFLAVIPWWWLTVPRDKNWRENISTIVAAGIIIVALETWLTVVIFGQNYRWLPNLYRWIRDTGVGEVTLIYGQMYRVFMQSQIFALVGSFFFIGSWWRGEHRWRTLLPITAGLTAVLLSLSRSFWLGLAVGVAVMIIITFKQWRQYKRLWPLALAVVLAVGLSSWAMNWPSVWPSGRGTGNAFMSRFQGADANDASAARKNQFRPLMTAISHDPVFGSGFGTSVKYYSTDPRVRGWRTTTAFELAYLDWWLEMGLIGLALLAWWLLGLGRKLFIKQYRVDLLPSLIALTAVHLTTPYLNHPLGLGWLALLMLFAYV